MGQCVMKDCGFNTDKLSSPQKKNLKLFLTEVLIYNYNPFNMFFMYWKIRE